jgi:hypothetical protein
MMEIVWSAEHQYAMNIYLSTSCVAIENSTRQYYKVYEK